MVYLLQKVSSVPPKAISKNGEERGEEIVQADIVARVMVI